MENCLRLFLIYWKSLEPETFNKTEGVKLGTQSHLTYSANLIFPPAIIKNLTFRILSYNIVK